MSRPSLTLRGRRVNGLPAGTMICVVAVLNLARHHGRPIVDPAIAGMARSLTWPQWGGCWWREVGMRGDPGACHHGKPKGAELS